MDDHRPSRILYNGHSGTIRYEGSLGKTVGIWLGIDWDNPERGKHDGMGYFTTRFPKSGSFIRPSSNVQRGVSILEAIRSKYLENLHGSETQETVVLGSSLGAIEVEAVNLDKIRQKLSRLDRLRDVSLDGTLAAYADPPGNIQLTCPNIRNLDLSLSLVCEWKDIAAICQELEFLQRLALNRNRLSAPGDTAFLSSAFNSLLELELNEVNLEWTNVQDIITQMPSLRSLEVGFNRFTNLGQRAVPHSTLESLNMNNNRLESWAGVMHSLSSFSRLNKLIISSNKLATIPPPPVTLATGPMLRYLSLASNGLSTWSCVENLSRWCPILQTLSIRENPIMQKNHARAFIISYFPTLLTLEGTAISDRERIDSEIQYLGDMAKVSEESGDARPFRWEELCEKHGKPQIAPARRDEEKLGSRLIALTLHRVSEAPTKTSFLEDASTLNVLPTMALRSLRVKLKKAGGKGTKKAMIWMRMRDGSFVELDTCDDTRPLDWVGLETGSCIAYKLE